jgi:pSer/pThr/pTyr-binding forkhead associated (FHA) protein
MANEQGRESASRIAKWLVERGKIPDAVELLCALAAAGPNDAAGQAVLAEAIRLDPGSPIARMAFERMEGIPGTDHSILDAAILRFNEAELARFGREMAPASFRRAQVGFNNNVKYKDQVFHVQTEDSGLDKPHIITHLFADGGRVIKSHKRIYAAEVHRPDVAHYVRALMKGQQMEMLLALRSGRFDEIVAGRARGGMDILEAPPDNDVKSMTRKKKGETSAPSLPPPPLVSATKKARCLLTVQRSLTGGPPSYALAEDETILGSQGEVTLPGERFCHPREAAIRWRDGRLWLEDFEGGNGAFLRMRTRVELAMGDEFILGDQLFRVERNPDADDEPDPGPTYFYSSPKWPSAFRVVQIFEKGGLGACAVSRGGMVQIGSVVGDLVIASDPLMSAQHCVLEEQAGVIVLTDLDSRTGVFVRLQGEAELIHGDEFLIGRTRLAVDLKPA